MPAWRGRLSQEEIRSVVTYIGTLSELGADDTEPSPVLELAGPAQSELNLNSAGTTRPPIRNSAVLRVVPPA